MDEFLFHPDIVNYLQELSHKRVSLPLTEGYEMYSETFPEYISGNLLTDIVQYGTRSFWLDKHIIIDPHRIVDINYSVGAHQSSPTGFVRRSEQPLKVLHYKHMGINYFMQRYQQLGERLSAYNLKNNYGTHYLTKGAELCKEMEQGLATAQKVINNQ